MLKLRNKKSTATFNSTTAGVKSHSLKEFVLLLFFVCLSITLPAQWIKDLRTNTYNSLTVQYWKAQQIVEVATYYSTHGKEEIKTETSFSVDRRQVSQTIYKNEERIASYVYQFNPRKQLMTKTIREQQADGSWNFTKQQYSYQGNLLRFISCYDVANSPLYTLKVENDSLGMPIKVVQLSPDSTVISSERAIANYASNQITYISYDAQGNAVSTEEGKIGFKKVGRDKINLHGDCYFYPKNRSTNDSLYCSVDIKYDSNGNWISKKIYEGTVNKSWELENPTLVSEFRRKIKYVK